MSVEPPALPPHAGRATRREFLAAAGGVGGTILLALSVPGFGAKNPEARRGAPGRGAPGRATAAASSQLNAWLVIGRDNAVTLIVDRSEMGQGVYTALPMLLAEELDIPLDRVKIVAAPVGDAYVNQGNAGQITGTSNSVQDAWEKLRTAGAQARLMLIAAAADRWRAKTSDCRAADGVIHAPDGRTLTYGEVAGAAASLPVPKEVSLKSRQEWKLVGRPLPRLDSAAKVDGSAEFGIDVKLPGLLHAAVAQSPVLGGRVLTVASAAATGMPGVRKVIPMATAVVVVAEHFWQALQARNALQITWDPGANAGLGNAAIRGLLESAAASDPGKSARHDGDAAAALESAHRSLDAVYELPMLAHAPMEPMNCTADVKAGGCDLYVGTQVQQGAQAAAAEAAGCDASKVRVFTTLLGGGFGRRLEVDFIPAAVIASKAVAAPVKVIWTREDDMMHDLYRPPAREHIRGGVDTQGRLTAWALHITSPSITARASPSTTDPFDSVVEAVLNCPYAVPNVSLTYTRCEIGIDVGYLRSVSHAPNCFVMESFMDELAAAAHVDPVQFRLAMLTDKPRHTRVLKTAAERAGWGRAAPGRFLGVAFMEGYATMIAQVAEVSVTDGRLAVHRITCVVDCGQMVNPRIVESQIESGIVFGLTAALWGEITLVGGRVQQENFNGYRLLRANEMPELDVHLIESEEAPGGIGEPGVAPVAPALGNAIFAATGRRLRQLPIPADLTRL